MPDVFVLVGGHVRLDRPGLGASAPGTVEHLLRDCHTWAAEVGWGVTAQLRAADGVVVGPGLEPPALPVPVAAVRPGQGLDGFRWAIRHLAYRTQWPPEVVRYGTADDHVADVRRPQPPSRGVAVLLHGGFWMDAWRRDLMDAVAVDLTRRGWTTWNAEYRRTGAGGGWPATGHDVVRAIDAAGGDGPGAPVVVGHSAGAQLALCAAVRRPGLVRQVVSLAGITDVDAALRHRLAGDATERFLGGEPAVDASPLEQLPVGVPLVLAHATGDGVVPVDFSRRFADAARQAGDAVELVELDSDDHMALIEPERGWSQVADLLSPASPAGS